MKPAVLYRIVLAACLMLLVGCAPCQLAPAQLPIPFLVAPLPTDAPPAPTSAPVQPQQSTAPAASAPSEPQEEIFWLSFAGDCTLGTEQASYGAPGSFVDVVGTDYAYPFASVLPYLKQDDFTLVNFEGTLTESTDAREKLFRFRAPPSYAQILTHGSVECVTLANNHSFDFGQTGYDDTKSALLTQGVAYVEHESTTIFTTSRGLCIGLYAAEAPIDKTKMKNGIDSLQAQGAQVIVCALHMGDEGKYHPTQAQQDAARFAVDCGAAIVAAHHPHVLEPIEVYGDGIIFYSLGNFSFGGNRNPSDKDTVIVQQEIILRADGTVLLGQTLPIPCRLSGHSGYNDYQPTPYDIQDPGYARVLSKLDGTFSGADLSVSYHRTAAPVQTDFPLPGQTQLPDGWTPVFTSTP